MVQIRAKSGQTGSCAATANEIASLVVKLPSLFTALTEFMRACPGEMSDELLDAALSSVDSRHMEETERFRTLMLKYYADEAWKTHDKRGYLVECIIASLDPEALGLLGCQNAIIHRHGFFLVGSRKLCSEHNIDLILEAGRVTHGIECKTKLSNWLTREGSVSKEAKRKLDYLMCLRSKLPHFDIVFNPWLASLGHEKIRCIQVLERHGYDCVQVIDAASIYDAIKKAA